MASLNGLALCFLRRGKMILIAIILLVLSAGLLRFGFRMASFSMGIKPQTLEEAEKWQKEHGDISWYYGLEKTDYTVEGYQGYLLHVQLVRNPEKTDKYVIISHGYTDNRFGALKYADFYISMGYNVIVYDLRGHGINKPDFCSYSIRESLDLIALIKDTRERYPDVRILGIHGESLGAATSIMCLKYKPEIDFVVADCPFSNITDVLKVGLKGMHLPQATVYVASLCARLKYGYSYGEMRPIDSLKDNEVPVLFIHGARDSFILPYHSERMNEVCPRYSEVHLMPNAEHAASVFADHDRYGVFLAEFLKNAGIE